MAKIINDLTLIKLSPVDPSVERVYFGPTNISKLHIKIYNEYEC